MCIKSQESKSKPCQGDSISRCEKRRLGGILRLEISKPCLHKSSCRTYFSGCIKERSNPRTSPVGYLLCADSVSKILLYSKVSARPLEGAAYSAISIAQIPVPVPKSKIRGP
jgi:hypothetical protein